MDLKEESVEEAATACKRQRRSTPEDADKNSSSNNSINAGGDGHTIVEESTEIDNKHDTEKTLVNSVKKTGNNNNLKDVDTAQKLPDASEVKEIRVLNIVNETVAGKETNIVDNSSDGDIAMCTKMQNKTSTLGTAGVESDSSNSIKLPVISDGTSNELDSNSSSSKEYVGEYNLSETAASAVLAASSNLYNSRPDSDDDDADAEDAGGAETAGSSGEGQNSNANTTPTFNRRTIPPTRSYRRFDVELFLSSPSNSTDSSHGWEDIETNAETVRSASVEELNDATSNEESNNSLLSIPLAYSEGSTESDANGSADFYFGDNDTEINEPDQETVDSAVNAVIGKSKPPYNWNLAQQIMHRENNISNRFSHRGSHTCGQSFVQGYYASRQAVESLTLTSTLRRHTGCVNSLHFNRTGDLICSGSDDLKIIIWDWAHKKIRHSIRSGHALNIFQTKFIDNVGCLDIVSSSRDGGVRLVLIPPSGTVQKPTCLYSHDDAVHKIVMVPHSRHEIMSAGEDSAVKHFDLRTNEPATTLLRCRDPTDASIRLFSIAHHPYAPEFCVTGSDDKLRVYDKRKCSQPVHEMYSKSVEENKMTQITCAVYNHSGSEILASYSDAGIYLFDSRNYKDGETLHCYEGHLNSRTIKGVNFFGPNSEYIVSGSDCGHIFLWDKNTECIVNFMKGDKSGVVNCLEPHPWIPVLATSGLEHHVKLWTPSGKSSVPSEEKLRSTLLHNMKRNLTYSADEDLNQFNYFIRDFLQGYSRSSRSRRHFGHTYSGGASDEDSLPEQEHSTNSHSSNNRNTAHGQPEDPNDSQDTDDGTGLDTLNCRTQ